MQQDPGFAAKRRGQMSHHRVRANDEVELAEPLRQDVEIRRR
jgi:hypothetical protein